MNFVELIGFVITMIALMMLSYKQSKEARRKHREEEPDEDSPERLKQDPAVQHLLRTLNIDISPPRRKLRREIVEEEEEDVSIPLPSPPSQIVADYTFKPRKAIKAYSVQKNQSRLQGDLLKKVSLKEAMILHVIFGPPKGS